MKYKFNQEIMRAYDIRGHYNKTLVDQDGFYLGKAMAAILKMRNLPAVAAVGRDGRLSSPSIHANLVKGLESSGVKVYDIGLVATPVLYFADKVLGTSVGVIVTGSHNPPDQNGFKMVMENKPFFGDDIQLLQSLCNEGKIFDAPGGSVEKIDMTQRYIEYLMQNAVQNTGRRLRIAWDPGNGATGNFVAELVKSIKNADHFFTNIEVDGHFPNHHPDPTLPENMEELTQLVLKNNCDIGFAFDGDGDRLGAIDNKGRMVFGDQLLLMFTKDLVSRHKKPKVVCDVKTSDTVIQAIARLGGEPIMWKTGHSLIKAKMREEQAMLGGEMSGHLFFYENYYGFDDALFGACKLINILSNSNQSLADFVDELPKSYTTPEIRIDVEESEKFKIIDNLKNKLNTEKISYNDLDGVRVQMSDGWWLVRASNTQNCLIVRVEGFSNESYKSNLTKVVGLFQNLGIDSSPLAKLG